MSLLLPIIRELDIFFSFTWRDWSTTIIPNSIFAVGAIRRLPTLTNPIKYLFLALWLLHYTYFFNLSNQITGVAEDLIDKIDRPIPSGKVSLQGAKIRWIIVTLSYLSLSIYQPTVFPETLAWMLTTAFLCLTSAGNHWFGKNTIAMPIGTGVALRATWKSIIPLDGKTEIWIYAVSAWVGILAHIQDFRDIKGDEVSGRKTMCLQYGDWETRLITIFVSIPLSLFVLYFARIIELAPSTLILVHIFLAYRLAQKKGTHYDHKTYMYLTYIFCFILAILSTEGVKLSPLYM